VFAGKRERLDTPARAALEDVLVMDGDDDEVDVDPYLPVFRICCIRLAQCICFVFHLFVLLVLVETAPYVINQMYY
jgi:hypothetical protein